MCGISLVILAKTERSKKEWNEIKKVFVANCVYNESRGSDASGLSVIDNDGVYSVCKKPMNIIDLVKTKPFKRTLNLANENTTVLLGHTRHPTKGSVKNPSNNHPIVTGNVIGVHNGHIDNDDSLFMDFGLYRRGEVDTEIIFKLQESVNPSELTVDEYAARLLSLMDKLAGSFVTISVDIRKPDWVTINKFKNPLSYHWEPRLKALFLSSRYVFLRKTFGPDVAREIIAPRKLYILNTERLNGFNPIVTLDLEPKIKGDGEVKTEVAHPVC